MVTYRLYHNKPLLMYISDKSNYNKNVEIIENKLTTSIPKVNELFKQYDFIQLLYEFKKYANNVEKDFKEYIKTNEIWNRLKK